jgi:cytochrome c biogenesis protein CcmG/thiol:disulfide interchange protein DsbE
MIDFIIKTRQPFVMKERYILLAVLLMTFCTTTLAQKTVYKSNNNKLYTITQKDSIVRAGNFVGIKDTIRVSDSIIYSFYFYDITLTYTAFQKRYHDKPLPRIALRDLHGNPIDTDELKGKVIMVNFWSTTCAPCIAEMQQLNDLARDYSKNVVFLGVAPENVDAIRSLLKKFRFDFTILTDGQGVFDELGIDGYPKNFFVDRNGIIKQIEEGTPVETSKDGTVKKENGEWKVLVYAKYSKILNELLDSE